MLRYPCIVALAILLPMAGAQSAEPAPKTTAGQQSGAPRVCADLAGQWEAIEKDAAFVSASGHGDSSGARESNRRLAELDNAATAALLYAMLKDNGCPLPKSPPLPGAYRDAAVKCALETNEQLAKTVCDRRTWIRNVK